MSTQSPRSPRSVRVGLKRAFEGMEPPHSRRSGDDSSSSGTSQQHGPAINGQVQRQNAASDFLPEDPLDGPKMERPEKCDVDKPRMRVVGTKWNPLADASLSGDASLVRGRQRPAWGQSPSGNTAGNGFNAIACESCKAVFQRSPLIKNVGMWSTYQAQSVSPYCRSTTKLPLPVPWPLGPAAGPHGLTGEPSEKNGQTWEHLGVLKTEVHSCMKRKLKTEPEICDVSDGAPGAKASKPNWPGVEEKRNRSGSAKVETMATMTKGDAKGLWWPKLPERMPRQPSTTISTAPGKPDAYTITVRIPTSTLHEILLSNDSGDHKVQQLAQLLLAERPPSDPVTGGTSPAMPKANHEKPK